MEKPFRLVNYKWTTQVRTGDMKNELTKLKEIKHSSMRRSRYLSVDRNACVVAC